jgi:hypothetical protein
MTSTDSSNEAITGCFFLVVFTVACFMPAQNDTWWHLRTGQEMWTRRFVMLSDEFSFTAAGGPWWNHEWLSDLVFYAMYRMGGLPALTAFCAAIVTGAVALAWRLMPIPSTDRVLIIGFTLVSFVPVWAIRPHVFTLLFLVLLVHLARREQYWIIPPLFALWANLHGGVSLGLVALAGLIVGHVYASGTARLKSFVVVAVLSVGATFVTPLGWHLWSMILETLTKSAANEIMEWQPPRFIDGAYFILWPTAIALLLSTLWLHRRATRSPRHALSADHAMLIGAAVALLPSALRMRRNVPPFLLIAIPTLTYAFAEWFRSPGFKQQPRNARVNTGAFLACAVVCTAIVATAWTMRATRLNWDPIPQQVAREVEACGDRVYNTYDDGGYLIWFAPRVRVFMDSRQDPFSLALTLEHRRVEETADYQDVFARYRIRCAALRERSSVARRLRVDGWRPRAQAGGWVVLEENHDARATIP